MTDRSPDVLTLALLFLGAAGSLALGVLFPMSDQAPVRLGAALIPVALAMAVATLVLGDRLPRGALLAQAAVAAGLNSLLVAYAHTKAGAMGDALAYAWLTVYVAVFFPRRTVPFAALVAAGFGAGLLAGGLPRMFAVWAVTSISILALGAVVAYAMRLARGHAATDDLTGALNRRGLRSAAAGAFLRTRRRDEALAVAVLDLDDFKAVNDADGHHAGDQLLADASAAWRRALRGDDVLARIGGDEFVVVMPDTTAQQGAAILERLRAAHPVAWSAGLTQWHHGESLEACLTRADRELYAAKSR